MKLRQDIYEVGCNPARVDIAFTCLAIDGVVQQPACNFQSIDLASRDEEEDLPDRVKSQGTARKWRSADADTPVGFVVSDLGPVRPESVVQPGHIEGQKGAASIDCRGGVLQKVRVEWRLTASSNCDGIRFKGRTGKSDLCGKRESQSIRTGNLHGSQCQVEHMRG